MTVYKEYNTNQLSLELNLAYAIPMNHEARLISLFVDSIPNHVLLEKKVSYWPPRFSSGYAFEDDPFRLCSSGLFWSQNSADE